MAIIDPRSSLGSPVASSSVAKNKPRIRKAPPKKGRKKKGAEPVVVTADVLRAAPLFAVLERDLLERLAPRVEHVELARGEHLFDGPTVPDDDDSPVFVVLFGDVSVSRGPGPDALRASNFLSVGEAYVQKLFVDAESRHVRLTAMCPVRALKLKYRDANYLLKKDATFRDAFGAAIRRITERQHTRFDDRFQGDIARFLVEQRLTFAGRVKIKRMDICIECDGCYDACMARHGTDRLGPSEVKYGLTEIPQNCHNCVVPECIDKCKFGMISKHPETHEIVISDDCTGCTMCSRGCSFGAIRMHSIADLDMARYFPDRSPDAKGKNIAQKCDNCTGYSDRACITACPTGAMFQVDGVELFDHWEQFTVHEAPGFASVASPEGTSAAVRWFWPLFTLLNFVVLFWETVGRQLWPTLTFSAAFAGLGWMAPLDPADPMKAGDTFGHTFGILGAACMLGTQLYRVGKRLAPRLGSVQAWMEAHIWLGVLGLVYAFFHTTQNFREPIAVATFLTMLLAIVTGVVGRYLLYLVPRSHAGQSLALQELEAQIRAVDQQVEESFVDRRHGHTMMVRVAEFAKEDATEEEVDRSGLFAGVARLLAEHRRQRRAIDGLRDEVEGQAESGKAAEVMRLLQEKARLERSLKRHDVLAKILKRYRVVHVTASNVMLGALLLHIGHSLMYAVG